MKDTSEFPTWELMSVNQFIQLAEHAPLAPDQTESIILKLTSVYDAHNLSTRLDALISLRELLNGKTSNSSVKALDDQCRNIIRLILRGPSETEIQNLLKNQTNSVDPLDKVAYEKLIDHELQKLREHREKRLPFKPDFVHDAPTKAPLRQLLEDLVLWNNEKDLEIKRENYEKIIRSSTVNTTKIFRPKVSDKLTSERRMFIILSLAHSLKHLLVKGTTKLVTESYQEMDLLRGVKIFSGKELEQKRLLPLDGHFYQLTLIGHNNDRCFKVNPFTTENMCAHGTHKGEAIFVETTAGDFFAASTVDSHEFGQSIFHSSLDRHPLFAGRIATDKNGNLLNFDNHTGHFLHNENNLKNITQHFYELGVLNEEVVATLVMQRSIPTEQAELLSYIKKLPEYSTQRSLQDPILIDNRFVDNLKSDPVNIRGYLATKKGESIKRKTNPLPAKDNREKGIRNDFENVGVNPIDAKAFQELEEVREKIRLKSRLDLRKFNIRFANAAPSDEQVQAGFIYFHPNENSKDHFSYKLRLGKKFIDSGEIRYTSLYPESEEKIKSAFIENKTTLGAVEITLLKKRAFQLSTYEQCLMRPAEFLFRHRFPKKSPMPIQVAAQEDLQQLANSPAKADLKKPTDTLAEIAQHLSRNAYNAFLEELTYHDKTHHLLDPRLQANHLFFGKMCLFRTNRSQDNSLFDPDKKGKRILQPLHEINHFKRKEKPTPNKKQSGHQDIEVEVVEENDFEGSLTLDRQDTYFKK